MTQSVISKKNGRKFNNIPPNNSQKLPIKVKSNGRKVKRKTTIHVKYKKSIPGKYRSLSEPVKEGIITYVLDTTLLCQTGNRYLSLKSIML